MDDEPLNENESESSNNNVQDDLDILHHEENKMICILKSYLNNNNKFNLLNLGMIMIVTEQTEWILIITKISIPISQGCLMIPKIFNNYKITPKTLMELKND